MMLGRYLTNQRLEFCIYSFMFLDRWLIQANGAPNSPLRYSMWVAYKHLPKDVTVPLKMLTEWPNANLQTTMTDAECAAVEEETPPSSNEPENEEEAPPSSNEPKNEVETPPSSNESESNPSEKENYSGAPMTIIGVAFASIFVAVLVNF